MSTATEDQAVIVESPDSDDDPLPPGYERVGDDAKTIKAEVVQGLLDKTLHNGSHLSSVELHKRTKTEVRMLKERVVGLRFQSPHSPFEFYQLLWDDLLERFALIVEYFGT